MPSDLLSLTASQAVRLIRDGELRSEALMDARRMGPDSRRHLHIYRQPIAPWDLEISEPRWLLCHASCPMSSFCFSAYQLRCCPSRLAASMLASLQPKPLANVGPQRSYIPSGLSLWIGLGNRAAVQGRRRIRIRPV